MTCLGIYGDSEADFRSRNSGDCPLASWAPLKAPLPLTWTVNLPVTPASDALNTMTTPLQISYYGREAECIHDSTLLVDEEDNQRRVHALQRASAKGQLVQGGISNRYGCAKWPDDEDSAEV